MTCTNPRLVRRRVPVPSKSGIVFRDADARNVELLEVPCGQCMACRIRRATEWSCRILHEITVSDSKEACFVTLTIDDDSLCGDSLIKRSVQLFIKRLRKFLDVPIKYYAVGEYGDLFQRPHYHLIIIGWSPPVDDLIHVGDHDGRKIWKSKLLETLWKFGFNSVGDASRESIDYVTGYVQKKLTGKFAEKEYGNRLAPFALISQGLGRRYVEEFEEQLSLDLYCMHNGVKTRLPRYYLNRMRVDKSRLEELRLERQKEKEVLYKDLLGIDGAVLLGAVERSERVQEEATLRASKKLFIGASV